MTGWEENCKTKLTCLPVQCSRPLGVTSKKGVLCWRAYKSKCSHTQNVIVCFASLFLWSSRPLSLYLPIKLARLTSLFGGNRFNLQNRSHKHSFSVFPLWPSTFMGLLISKSVLLLTRVQFVQPFLCLSFMLHTKPHQAHSYSSVHLLTLDHFWHWLTNAMQHDAGDRRGPPGTEMWHRKGAETP